MNGNLEHNSTNGTPPVTAETPPNDDQMISIDEAAKRFNVASRVLRAALGAGECKGKDFGGRIGWRMWPRHVREWLDKLVGDTGKAAPKPRRRAKTKATKAAAKPAIKVGQTWKDRDTREGGRKVKIVEVKPDVIVVHNPAHKDPNTKSEVKASAFHRRFVLVG